MEAVKFHAGLDDNALLPSSAEWCVLRLLLRALEQFMYAQTKLEPNKVLPFIWDLRTSLTYVLDNLRELAPGEDEANVSQTRDMFLP